MKFKTYISFLAALFISCSGKSQNRIQVNIPTVDEETEYIWRTIQDINFFEENNYQISLPKGAHIELLKTKAKEKSLSDDDYKNLKTFIKDRVYENPKLTLSDVASALHTNTKVIYSTVNTGFQMNFNDFINHHRIEAVKSKLEAGEHNTTTL